MMEQLRSVEAGAYPLNPRIMMPSCVITRKQATSG